MWNRNAKQILSLRMCRDSGYGVIGKKPEINIVTTAQKEEELVILQRTILDKAAEICKTARSTGIQYMYDCKRRK